MPTSLKQTSPSMKPYIDARTPGGISLRELGEIQLERARRLARGEEVGGLRLDYEKSFTAAVRDSYDAVSPRLEAASGCWSRESI